MSKREMTPLELKFRDLRKPFLETEIEWRVGQCGKKNGQFWAKVLAYVQARAIQDRFDQVFGPDKWQVKYDLVKGEHVDKENQSIGGVFCHISVFCDGNWVTKTDGAEQTDIESFKGGLSSAFKRTGSVWGAGRYLYDLEATFAEIVTQGTKGARYAVIKESKEPFFWMPPKLPDWALPAKEEKKINPFPPDDAAKPSFNSVSGPLDGTNFRNPQKANNANGSRYPG